MKSLEFIKEDGRHRFIIGREFKTTIHEFLRAKDDHWLTDDPKEKHPEAYFKAEIDMKMTCSGCPVQYEGTINGQHAYYRDRWGSWYLEIYDEPFDPKSTSFDGKIIYRRSGQSRDIIGYEGFVDAEHRIIRNAIRFAKKQKTKKIANENN